MKKKLAFVLIGVGALILVYLAWVVIGPIVAGRHCNTVATDQAEQYYQTRQTTPVGATANQDTNSVTRDQQYEDDFQSAYTVCMEERGFAD